MFTKALLSGILLACIWDDDTIRMEREWFPGLHEILAGKFVRHSRGYYEWRVVDRGAKTLRRRHDPALADDLAVAYDKTGRTGEAIRLMRKSLDRHPRRYETLANLGTFLIHDGQFEEGLRFIRRAIDVNPDAHFGREVVQAHLVEYLLARRPDGRLRLPLRMTDAECSAACAAERAADRTGRRRRGEDPVDLFRFGFAGFKGSAPDLADDPEKLARGLTGMMFFGHHESAVLAECLGDVLRYERHYRLACRAYLKASYSAPDEECAALYREFARDVIARQTVGGLIGGLTHRSPGVEGIEELFLDELEEGRDFFAEIEAREAEWAEMGLDLDEEFAREYYEVGRTEDLSLPIEWETVVWWLLGAAGAWWAVRRVRRELVAVRYHRGTLTDETNDRRFGRIVMPFLLAFLALALLYGSLIVIAGLFMDIP